MGELEKRLEKPPTPRRTPESFYRPPSQRMLDISSEARMSDYESDAGPDDVKQPFFNLLI